MAEREFLDIDISVVLPLSKPNVEFLFPLWERYILLEPNNI
jgi:hypothetical protein